MLLSVCCVPFAAQAATNHPNIILMMADDMGWGDPSYNDGWINTPSLDSMASSGLRFDRFYAACAVCSPTRASCLTGRNPFRVGVENANAGHLGRDETPLSEVLDNAGYQCAHFGKWHLGTLTTLRNDSNRGEPGLTAHYSPPWHHQYDTCFATEAKVPTYHPMRMDQNGLPEPVDFADTNFYGTHYWTPPLDPATWTNSTGEGVAVAVTNNMSGDDSRVMMDRVVPFIQNAVASNQPFFAVVWFHTPHRPVMDPEQVSGADSPDAYTDAIQGMDTQIGRLRTELDSLGVRTNTMLWFCSDNGPENGPGKSGGLRARKRSLHEGGVRVPGLLEWPAKVPIARTTDYPCVTSDYYPTIIDALDLSVTNQKPIDGVSLMPLITNETFSSSRLSPIGFRFGNDRSWVTQQYKLISKNGGSSYELYDLLADVKETTNIAASEPEVAARLQLELETWIDAVNSDTVYVAPTVSGWSDAGVSNETVTTTNAQVYATLEVPSGSNTTVTLEWDTTNAPTGGWAFTNSSLPDTTGGIVTAWLTGLVADTEYWFRFTATNEVDGSDTSMATRVVTDLSVTQIPAISGILSNGTDIALEWVDWDDNGTGFVVEYYQEGSAVTGHQETASTNWTHYTGVQSARFFYRVGATNAEFGGSFSGYSDWTNQVTGEAVVSTGTTTVLTSPAFNTVDGHGDIPGDDSNNIDKFDVGGSDPAEFTTTLYTRGNGSDLDKRVRAYVKFDLASLGERQVTGATLSFRGYSLNDKGGGSYNTDLEVLRLTEDWATAADPFGPATTATINAGPIRTSGAPTTGTNFSVDVTVIVSNWISGAVNHGFFLKQATLTANNGLGMKIDGEGAIELEVRQAGTVDAGDTDGDGILDAWELRYWSGLTNANETTFSDADPHTDLQEYITDTDPTDSNSYFRLTDLRRTNSMAVTFDSSTERVYVMQSIDDLMQTNWDNVPGQGPRLGTGTNDMMIDSNDSLQRFYRVEVSLPE